LSRKLGVLRQPGNPIKFNVFLCRKSYGAKVHIFDTLLRLYSYEILSHT